MELSDSLILNAFYTYSGSPSFNVYDGNYNASCPVCREGKSWGKKKRLYFYPKTKSFFCFNCQRSWSALNWIMDVSGQSRQEILSENQNTVFSKELKTTEIKKHFTIPDLPYDSINITDAIQQKYYSKNKYFCKALDYVKQRKLDTAINTSKNFFISFTDKIHKNRMVIPFYDLNNKIIFYQTRALDGSEPRYLGKAGYDKSIFGIERIDSDFDYIFIFEGPIDSMFVKNGVAVCGLTLTKTQKEQLSQFPFHKKVWILDNLNVVKDNETKEKTIKLLNQSEKVFKWPNLKYKDFNDLVIDKNINEISPEFILKNLY